MKTPNTPLASLAFVVSMLTFGDAYAHPDPALFAETAFIKAPEVVDCTLENGTNTHCYEFTVGYLPGGLEIGPFCPATISDEGGIWAWDGEHAGLYRLDHDFWVMLADLGYRFYDETGKVYIADPAAGPPTVDDACLSAAPDTSVIITMRLPVDPVMADAPTQLGTVAKVGVALDGVPIFADAPSVLDTGHLPALDVCGGHIDPGGWYHWHGTSTDIETSFEHEKVVADCGLAQNPAAQFGYVFDGFAIFGSREADGALPQDLDACNGHIGVTADDAGEVYHYHATETFPNLPPCLVGVPARDNFSTTAKAGIGAVRAGQGGQGGPGGIPPGFEAAAQQLGVSAEALMQAMAEAGGPQAKLAVAAEALGVSEEELRNALPPPQ